MRTLITLHPSEWSSSPSWKTEIINSGDLKKAKAKDIEALVDEQIVPTLWWDDVAGELHLPKSSSDVYTFHPLTFVKWLNEQLLDERGAASSDVRLATKEDLALAAAGKTGKAKMDLDDVHGESFVNAEELRDIPPDKKLEIKDLIDGFGD